MSEKRLIDLYAYRKFGKTIEFLLFKRAKGKIYEGQWRMVGGKVKTAETYWEAALRELKEETGLEPVSFWTIPSVNQFYEPSTDKILTIPAFAAEIAKEQQIALDEEHTEFKWFTPEMALKKIAWPEQKRLIKLTSHLITTNRILDDWRVSYQ